MLIRVPSPVRLKVGMACHREIIDANSFADGVVSPIVGINSLAWVVPHPYYLQ
jgi:hypothetical protein